MREMATLFGNSQVASAHGSMWNDLTPQQEVAPSQDLFAAWYFGEDRPTAPGPSGYDYIHENMSAFPVNSAPDDSSR